MGELVVWRWSIHPHLTQIAKCIATLGYRVVDLAA